MLNPPRTTQPTDDLMRAKRELVAARERHEAGALGTILARYPGHAAALIEFSAALAATSGYADVALTAETERIAAAARARAFASVFGAAIAPAAVASAQAAPSFASLKALRQARKLTLRAVADRLGLGIDVLSALEAGRIRARSVPERLVRGMGELLDTTADQVAALLGAQAMPAPAFRRARSGETKEADSAAQVEFAEAVRHSPEMTGEQKATWLAE